jgi:hypothetical protein
MNKQLLESNLIRIIDPSSCVDLDQHVLLLAEELMEMPLPTSIVEKS